MSAGIPLENCICYASFPGLPQSNHMLELEGSFYGCMCCDYREEPRAKGVVKGGEKVQPLEVSPVSPSQHWACLLNLCFSTALLVKIHWELLPVRPLPCMFCSSSSQELARQMKAHGPALGFQSFFRTLLLLFTSFPMTVSPLSTILSFIFALWAWIFVCFLFVSSKTVLFQALFRDFI